MVRAKGLEVHTVKGEDLTIIGCIGDTVVWIQAFRSRLFC